MTTIVSLRKGIDRKQWEQVTNLPNANAVNYIGAASTLFDQIQFWMNAINSCYLYYPTEDAYVMLPTSGMTTFTLTNMSVVYHPSGPTGTASAGAAQTLTTTLTIPASLAGYTIRITGGTGAGQEQVILRNTYGANSVITVTNAWATNPDNTSTYLILSGRFWVLCGSSTICLSYYDMALNTWTSRSVTGMTASIGGGLVATPSYGNTIVSGTATSGSATTLTNSGKAWTTNQFANYQVRITAGTGAGKVATITSNTSTVLTFPTVTTVLDSTSVYVIEPDDNAMYASNALATYKYSISGNSWSTLSPGNARTTTLVNSGTYNWVGVASDSSWADETNIKNGRYIYSFAGGGTVGTANNLAVYDIALNTWVNTQLAYGHSGATGAGIAGNFVPTGVSSAVVDREFIYIVAWNQFVSYPQTNPIFRFNTVANTLENWAYSMPSAASSNAPHQAVIYTYTDGGTSLRWMYLEPSCAAPQQLQRMLII